MIKTTAIMLILLYILIMLKYATPQSHTQITAPSSSIPLNPLNYKTNEGSFTYDEMAIQGELKVYIEESFFLIMMDTNLTVAYDFLTDLKSQVTHLKIFLANLTSHTTHGHIKSNHTYFHFQEYLLRNLDLKLTIIDESIQAVCVLKEKENLRQKRGLFNPVGKVLNLLFGQGDPDTISELVNYYRTHKGLYNKIIKTEGLTLDTINAEDKKLNLTWNQISGLNHAISSEKGDLLGLELCMLALAQFQIVSTSLENFLNSARFQVATGKSKYLSRASIPETELELILRNVTLKTHFKLPFVNISNYYNAPLMHVQELNCEIRQTLILPLINPHQPYTIEKTEPRFPDLMMYVIRNPSKDFRYLTQRDFDSCLKGETNSLICNKRKIVIFDKYYVGCKGTCKYDTSTFVHDLNNAHIIAILPNNETIAEINCNGKIYSYTMPQISTFYLPEHCELATSIFRIEKITKVPIEVIPHKSIMIPTEISYDKAVETLQLQEFLDSNYTTKVDQKFTNLTKLYNNLFNTSMQHEIDANSTLKRMDQKFEFLEFMHWFVITPVTILLTVVVGILLYMYCCQGCCACGKTGTDLTLNELPLQDKTTPDSVSLSNFKKLELKVTHLEHKLHKLEKDTFTVIKGGLNNVADHQKYINDILHENLKDVHNLKVYVGMPCAPTLPSAPNSPPKPPNVDNYIVPDEPQIAPADEVERGLP